MRYYILLFITFLFPVCIWGQFDPSNPGDPSMNSPQAKFGYDEMYKNRVAFRNESRSASRFEWNFGDGTTSTEKHPEHTYQASGEYKVTLTAYNGTRQSHTDSLWVSIPEEYTMSGDFTLDPSKNGIRNFPSLDDLFKDLMELTIDGDVTITVAKRLNLSLSELNMSEVADKLIQKLKDSPYKVGLVPDNNSYSNLHLWNEFNQNTYEQFEQLIKYIDFQPDVYLGDCRFSLSNRARLFQPKSICYGRQSEEIAFDWYSDTFTYEWKLAETPDSLSGYTESGVDCISPKQVTTIANRYKPLVYNVSFVYQGEVYATEQVVFWVYPQKMYLNLLEPSANGVVATPNDVNLSWELIPGYPYRYYEVYMRKQGEGEFEHKGGYPESECHISNHGEFFQYDQTYEWYVEISDRCNGGEIRSEIRTFTIGSAADLEITDITVEPKVAVSGKAFTVTATVTNNGTKAIETKTWTDRIGCMNSNESMSRSQNHSNASLAVGESYELSFTFEAPHENELELLTFELELDTGNDLQELNKSNNRKEIEIPLALRSIPEEEYSVLCALYEQAGGDQWKVSQHWDISTNVVDKDGWEGVELDEEGHVLGIDLSQRNLVGTLPAGIFSLPYLKVLDLSGNSLTGKLEEIIPEGSTAPELVTVNLGQNQLSGTVPASIDGLPKLETLTLGGNRLDAVEEVLLKVGTLDITGQALPDLQIPLRHKFELKLPGICLYDHGEQTKEKWPAFSLKVSEAATEMGLKYEDGAYGFVWNNHYHVINLPSEQDLVLTQTNNSAKGSQATIQLLFNRGDANMDGDVDLEDIRHTLNFIQEDNNSDGENGYIDFNYYAANTYQEEQVEPIINVQDLVATVNILLETPQTQGGSDLRSTDVERSGPAAFLSVEEGKLVVDNPAEAIMDLDITLKGVTSKQIELLLPANNYLYQVRDVEGGVRFVLVCMNGVGIPLGKTDVMKIKGSGVSLTHVHLTNRMAKEVRSDFKGKQSATGNETVTVLDGWSAGNLRIDRDVKALVVSVYDMSGHLLFYHRLREVVPGDYKVAQWLPQELSTGIYLVHIELHKANEIKHQTIKVSLTK